MLHYVSLLVYCLIPLVILLCNYGLIYYDVFVSLNVLISLNVLDWRKYIEYSLNYLLIIVIDFTVVFVDHIVSTARIVVVIGTNPNAIIRYHTNCFKSHISSHLLYRNRPDAFQPPSEMAIRS